MSEENNTKKNNTVVIATAEVKITKEDIADWKVRQAMAEREAVRARLGKVRDDLLNEFVTLRDALTEEMDELTKTEDMVNRRAHLGKLVSGLKTDGAYGEYVLKTVCEGDWESTEICVQVSLHGDDYQVATLGTVTIPITPEIEKMQVIATAKRDEYDTANAAHNVSAALCTDTARKELRTQFLDEILDQAIAQINGDLTALLPYNKEKACPEQPKEKACAEQPTEF